MAPREIGGVVNPLLKVYGMKNLCVVDVSVIPLQFGATPISTIHAVTSGKPKFPYFGLGCLGLKSRRIR